MNYLIIANLIIAAFNIVCMLWNYNNKYYKLSIFSSFAAGISIASAASYL